MRSSYAAAAALVLFTGGAALAGQMMHPTVQNTMREPVTTNPQAMPSQPDIPRATDLQVGIGVICNTNEQAKNYIKLRARGTEISMAVTSVNQQAKDPKACGVAAIAFRSDKTMSTQSLNGKVVNIVRVDVMAGYDGHGWSRVPSMTQYAIIQTKGIAI